MTSISSFSLQTRRSHEWIDITPEVQRIIAESRVTEGIAAVYIPHTTASVTVNESADPQAIHDVMLSLKAISPDRPEFRHREGNSAAHTLASLMGPSVTLIVSGGAPILGTWQGVWFMEFDGPRTRNVFVRVLGE